MKYNLKTDNYKRFDIFKDNVMVPRSYFIPFSTISELEKCDIRNERYISSSVECLSGEWDFIYYKDFNDIPEELDSKTVEFDKVNVPSTWQHTGYEMPYYVNSRYPFKPNPPEFPTDCPAGVYRKIFTVEDEKLNYYISFLGVAGSLDLFCNGQYVGYSEGSHNTAQFELNKFITCGENEIIVVNHKWSNGTYLECQDMFRCNGIFRDVLLYKSTDNSIYDFEVKTDYIEQGKYKLGINPALKIIDDCQLTAFIYDGKNMIASKSVNVTPNQCESVEFSCLDVEEWSAEIPKLYELVLTLSKGEDIIEVIRRNIGFKHIEIKGNVFYFNNRPIKLLGVNHHDTNPKTGYVLTVDEMEKDVSLVKEYNGNCIRTSHYPPDPSFLDLCDEYGIYVVDEADIETHGCEIQLHKPGACSHNDSWREHYWDRVYRMFERDKNHACITMWSLGNEAHGYLNQDYCYDNLKKFTSIPIHYEGVCRTKRWAYDVVSHMYTFPNICERIAKGKAGSKYAKKPFYLCEYAHAMGVGAGELERYVNCFYSADNMLGGCIWEFADHAVFHESGDYEYTYGGDHGEYVHDKNFCVDGLFYPDRTPHSGALQMKACYCPVTVSKKSLLSYVFTSRNYFADINYTVKYTVLENGYAVLKNEFKLNIMPQCSVGHEIEKFDFNKSENTIVRFDYYDGDFLVSSQEIELSKGELIAGIDRSNEPVVKESEKRLFIYFENGSMIFDKKTCFIDSYEYKGVRMLNPVCDGDFKGIGLNHYRAPLDNDMNINFVWRKMRLDTTSTFNSKCSHKVLSDRVEITYMSKLKTAQKFGISKNTVTLSVYGDGSIKYDVYCNHGGSAKLIPRYGIQLELEKEFSFVKYFGLGPQVNLPDFKAHALTGIYETTVEDMPENYIKPQESATRCETRIAQVTNDSGLGLRFEAIGKPFVFSAAPYTPLQCAKATHREDLPHNTTCINIDSEVMGAGSNSCGPFPSKQYRLGSLKGKELSLLIKPIG